MNHDYFSSMISNQNHQMNTLFFFFQDEPSNTMFDVFNCQNLTG
jgi:hypothetical protein